MSADEHPMFRVRLRLLTADEGGRQTPIAVHYRPQWNILRDDGTYRHHDAQIQHLADEWLSPGETAEAIIEPFFPEYWRAVQPGMTIGIFEGARQVGVSEVLTVPPEEELRHLPA